MVFGAGFNFLKQKSLILFKYNDECKQEDTEIIEELLADAIFYNVSVYAVGSGNNVQEDVLKIMSSPPQEVKNYLRKLFIFNSYTDYHSAYP